MFHLLILLSLLACNGYGVVSVSLTASMLNQRGYNNQSTYVYISDFTITDIDPNAFKGYTQMTYLSLIVNASKLDLGLFKDSVNLGWLRLFTQSAQITNLKKITLPSLMILYLYDYPLASLDTNVINGTPNLSSLFFSSSYSYINQPGALKTNQLSPLLAGSFVC